MAEDHFKAQELQFLYFQKVHFSYYSINKPQIKAETLRGIVVSNYSTRETRWPRLFDVDTWSVSAPLSDVHFHSLWGALMGTWTAAGFHNPLSGVLTKDWQERARVSWEYKARTPTFFYWSPLTLATVAQWTTRSVHRLGCFVFLTLFPLSYINSQALLNSSHVNWFLFYSNQHWSKICSI